MLLVSVILTSFNYSKFIAEAIQSVLNQSICDLELIIIDDASQDNSRQIIEDFQKKDSRIKVIFHSKNMGIVKTTNEGISEAIGKYIAFIDSDDVWEKDKLAEQIKVLDSNKNLIVWTEGEIINSEGKPTGDKFTKIYGSPDKKTSGSILEKLLKDNYILGSSFMAARESLNNICFRDGLRYLNDWLFFTEVAEHYEYFFIDKLLTKYRIHGNNTNTDVAGFLKDYFKINHIFHSKYKTFISKEVKSSWYNQRAVLYDKLGLEMNADFYILNEFLVNPENVDAKDKLTMRLKNRYPLLYRILRKAVIFLRFKAI